MYRHMYVCMCAHMCIYLVHKVYLPYIVFGFDVCSSTQQELQGREMASPSSPVERGQPTLMKTKINQPGTNKLSYRIIITNCSYITLKYERVQVGY